MEVVFPTSAEIQYTMEDLALLGVKLDVAKARPELKEVVADGPRRIVTLELPDADQRSYPLVVVGRLHEKYTICWLVYGRHKDGTEVELTWPLDVPSNVLTEAVLAVYDACSAGTAPRSPWRWCQPDDNEGVRLADALSARGLTVSGVLGTYAWSRERRPYPISQSPRPSEIAVRVECAWGRLVLARRRRLGWVLDAEIEGRTQRLDLEQLIRGTLFSTTGLEHADLSLLVTGMVAASRERPQTPDADEDEWSALLLSDIELEHRAVARRLHEMNVEATVDGPTIEAGNRIIVTGADIDLAWAQRGYAQTLVDHNRKGLMVFTTGHVTRGAAGWLEKASVPIFGSWDEFRTVRSLNRLADEHLLLSW